MGLPFGPQRRSNHGLRKLKMNPTHPTRIEQLLSPLRKSVINKSPYVSGTLRLPARCFSLFYKISKDSHAARHINLANATFDESEKLAQACEPPSVGVNEDTVIYRKAVKVPGQDYLGLPLEGLRVQNKMKIELQSLNEYTAAKGSFFKPHIDTLRRENMFVSLVIIFPTGHEDGTLLLRHRGHEWSFDSLRELAAVCAPSIGFVLFDDIEYKVSPVISGHYVTSTYNLYLDDGVPVSSKDSATEHISSLANECAFREAFEMLLENPEFLADGGTLGFWLRRTCSMKDDIKDVYGLLKGRDAVVYRSARETGSSPCCTYTTSGSHRGSRERRSKILSFEDQSGGEMMKDLTRPLRERSGNVRDLIRHARIRERGSNGCGIGTYVLSCATVKSQPTTETKNVLETRLLPQFQLSVIKTPPHNWDNGAPLPRYSALLCQSETSQLSHKTSDSDMPWLLMSLVGMTTLRGHRGPVLQCPRPHILSDDNCFATWVSRVQPFFISSLQQCGLEDIGIVASLRISTSGSNEEDPQGGAFVLALQHPTIALTSPLAAWPFLELDDELRPYDREYAEMKRGREEPALLYSGAKAGNVPDCRKHRIILQALERYNCQKVCTADLAARPGPYPCLGNKEEVRRHVDTDRRRHAEIAPVAAEVEEGLRCLPKNKERLAALKVLITRRRDYEQHNES
ncbi:hypothetical protein BJV74DRAFT_796683 [Russula compacta]|nr:hypothetical protein BJV74DRAFT_796683 [Russula compacta]